MEQQFLKLYPDAKEINKAFCPYRVCPLGAHSDHQHGLVSGFAIDKGITIYYAPTENGEVNLVSTTFENPVSFLLSDDKEKQGDWADYLRGAVMSLKRKYTLHRGINALICGSLPIGGLSSSAAVILAFMSAMCRVNDIALDKAEAINIALWAEKDYVGVNVGKLDQSCEMYCEKDKLLFLDTLDDTFELIPKSDNMKPFEIAVFFSGVERNLIGSKFNMRVDELKSAAYALMAFSGMEYGSFADARLRQVPVEIFEKYKDKLPENWRKRATHFYTEFERVKMGAEAWRKGDMVQFGKLSSESGYSSIYNYETGSDELKTLYEIMMQTDGIYGGRFSGAGFKGCCIGLIDPAFKEEIMKNVTEKYINIFPQYKDKFSVHFCSTSDGCKM
jgi:galactokinase